MNIAVRHICLCAALGLTALPHPAAAQQVISKNAWVLKNPADPGYGSLGVFPTAQACVEGRHALSIQATGRRAAANAALDAENAKIKAAPNLVARVNAESASAGAVQDDANAYEFYALVDGANCVQQ
jgi:hypothetical protein